tara:strand:+ start:646 stop:951 length:306 start_codon:yes stop_codon:yes gene_type:complete
MLAPDSPDIAVETEGLLIVKGLLVRFLFLLFLSALFSTVSATCKGSGTGATTGGGGGACILGLDKHMVFSFLICYYWLLLFDKMFSFCSAFFALKKLTIFL